MAINTEKNTYTVIFATIMVAVVGSILAFLASSLRPAIEKNERFEKQQNILYAMGVNENDGDSGVNFVPTERVEEEFSKYIKKQLVIDPNGNAQEDPEAFLIDMKKQLKAFKEGNEAKFPLFVGEKDGKKFYILPMYGKGLWDAIWGYISLDENMVVQGVYFDHKAETPGLGANIKMRFFMDDFEGESVLDGNSFKGIAVVKGNNDPLNQDKDDNEVDALAGATITGNGVTAMINETLKIYRPYLETLRNN
ncbi:Na(+)-translocating NADH-quinone reductase subunit C [Flagellimonas lutaonensis]|uniref:Na(+)-translocating NADH-quinone reductase subunit C n=1 Tax=Flagellimonas lutaonensis TaxID=516051 RepID=A0A0D5YV05_9FLAO|nr:Na(+)-translocating NADH-quinone reductase subunit C [Allomuricauda lutaonensis]AKA35736.1 NADH:quinone oxidoreductase subunit C [Allomuricauda lutaonensis]